MNMEMIKIEALSCGQNKRQLSVPDYMLSGIDLYVAGLHNQKWCPVVEYTSIKSIFVKEIYVKFLLTPTQNPRTFLDTLKSFLDVYYKEQF